MPATPAWQPDEDGYVTVDFLLPPLVGCSWGMPALAPGNPCPVHLAGAVAEQVRYAVEDGSLTVLVRAADSDQLWTPLGDEDGGRARELWATDVIISLATFVQDGYRLTVDQRDRLALLLRAGFGPDAGSV